MLVFVLMLVLVLELVFSIPFVYDRSNSSSAHFIAHGNAV